MSTTQKYWTTPSKVKVIYDVAPQPTERGSWLEVGRRLCNKNALRLKWGDGYIGVSIDQNIKLYMQDLFTALYVSYFQNNNLSLLFQ